MNKTLSLWRFALNLFGRDFTRGSLLNLVLAIHLSMLSASVIYLILDRLDAANSQQVAEVLGADLVITSPHSIAEEWQEQSQKLSLTMAKVVEFPSVLVVAEKLQLASVKAISANYPLKGQILIEPPSMKDKQQALRPIKLNHLTSGRIWLEPRLATLLEVNGELSIELGYADLQFEGIIKNQPNQNSSLFNIAPSAIILGKDLAKTKILQPGSRVTYRYLFVGSKSDIKSYRQWIHQRLDSSQRLVSLYDQSRALGSSIDKSRKYINLTSILTLLLLSVAIAMSVNRYTQKQFDMSALMRCFGLNSNQVLKIFIWVLFFVALLAIVSGGLLGYLFQYLLLVYYADLFPSSIGVADWTVMAIPALSSFILLYGFSLPALMRLKKVSPMRVLRRQLEPLKISGGLIYLVAVTTLALILYLQIGDLKLVAIVSAVILIMLILLALVSTILLSRLRRWSFTGQAAINFSLKQLYANRSVTLIRILAFASSLFVMALIFIIKTELITKWQQSLSPDAPNHFMVNISAEQKIPLEQLLTKKSVLATETYPMVRGRLVQINQQPIKQVLSKDALSHNSLRRELNITWTNHLPKGNRIERGQWGWTVGSQNAQISVDAKMAKRLGINIDDQLTFSIGGQQWTATIVNIRSIDWQTLTPNFYIIANPNSLDAFSPTYIKAFRLNPAKKGLVKQLTKDYPNAIIIELDKVFEQIKAIISKASQAIEMIMVFVFSAGLVLLWASMEYTYSEKMRQSAILRTLGASRGFIASSLRFEFAWLTVISVLIALSAVEISSYGLYKLVFDVEYELHYQLWWELPSALLLMILVSSWRGINRLTRPPPLSLLG
ncbi:MAG: hypothetical protein Q9M92_12930 [Enterobacterales bacterium]|nr:hypothetical protein [Enterobacterales bacterium]